MPVCVRTRLLALTFQSMSESSLRFWFHEWLPETSPPTRCPSCSESAPFDRKEPSRTCQSRSTPGPHDVMAVTSVACRLRPRGGGRVTCTRSRAPCLHSQTKPRRAPRSPLASSRLEATCPASVQTKPQLSGLCLCSALPPWGGLPDPPGTPDWLSLAHRDSDHLCHQVTVSPWTLPARPPHRTHPMSRPRPKPWPN